MKLPFAEISQETSRLAFSGAGWFPADEVTCSEAPLVEIRVRRKGKKVLLEGFRLPSMTNALYYHADYVKPNWNKPKIGEIGRHIFYGERR